MQSKKIRLLVSAYAFSPTLGSEFAQGWNYCRNIGEQVDLTVLIGSSDGKMGEFSHLDDYCKNNELGFEVVKVQPDLICKVLNFLDRNLKMGWFFVLSLRRWNKKAFFEAERLHEKDRFTAVHHLGPLGFKNPGMLYKLGIASYLGPIGGFQFINARLAYKSSPKYFYITRVRNLLNFLFVHERYINRALNGYDRISFVTSTNQKNFSRFLNVSGPIISDQGAYLLNEEIYNKKIKKCREGGGINLIWCGSLDNRKNIRLLLNLVVYFVENGLKFNIEIVGDGPLRGFVENFINKHHCWDFVKYHGRVPRVEALKLMEQSDVILFTSLSEANTATFYEALTSFTIPVALDLDGFSDNIKNDIGYLINANDSYDEILRNYYVVLKSLEENNNLLRENLKSIYVNYRNYTWEAVVTKHLALIKGAINGRRHSKASI